MPDSDVVSVPATSAGPSAKAVQRAALLDRLYQEFSVLRDYQPLAIGIHKTVMERLPEVPKIQIRTALQHHTAKTRYLKALVEGVQRLNLDANPTGAVTAEQQSKAAEMLRDRFRKLAERRKAELEAQQHQEKLVQLAGKFNPR
jgi:ProP effector